MLPRWCACGNRIELLDETRCEVCYSLDQQRYDGKSQRVKSTSWPQRQTSPLARSESHVQTSTKGRT